MAIEVIESIYEHIENGENFLLSGGAGSGKTYTLMQVLDLIYEKNPIANVACITYTKVAVAQIEHRSAEYKKNLRVSTIHNFLWDSIKPYQTDVKKALIHLIALEKKAEKSGIEYRGTLDLNAAFLIDKTVDEISYEEYKKIEEGKVSHDEVLKIANYMYKEYPLLRSILIDKYDFILIDEYQDTEKQVVEIFLDFLPLNKNKKNVIGFFGDSMQSIYDNGVGSLQQYIEKELVEEVKKQDNWRCSRKVIGLLNHLRKDIQQKEMCKNLEGSIKFIYSDKETIDIEKEVKKHDVFKGWIFSDTENTKELYLTHNLISKKAGFDEIYSIYNKDEIIKHIKEKIDDYLKKNPNDYSKVISKTLEEVLNLNLVQVSKPFEQFIIDNKNLYDIAKALPFEYVRRVRIEKDYLIGEKRDKLIQHLFKIQDCIYLYENNKVNEFIKKTDYKIKSILDKTNLKKVIDKLKEMKNESIENVVNFAHTNGIVKKDDDFNNFVTSEYYNGIYDSVKQLNYQQLINLYNFEEKLTPYSTQHGIKGAEFNNVFVILDNGKWNSKYNFKDLFEGKRTKKDKETKMEIANKVFQNTEKIFYVCCSRAKDNLVVFYHKPTKEIILKAEEWFGKINIIKI